MICVALNVAVNDLEIQLWGLDWHVSQSGEADLKGLVLSSELKLFGAVY